MTTDIPTPESIPDRKPKQDLGKAIEGVVTSVSTNSVELDLDDGRQAIIERAEFGLHNERPDDIVSKGDKCVGIELDREHPTGRVVLSRSWALRDQAWVKAGELCESGETTNGLVTRTRGGGVEVDLGVPAFLPQSHLTLEKVEDLAEFIGKSLEVKVIEVNRDKGRLVVSRRALLNAEKRKQHNDAIAGLKIGSVHTGIVDSVVDYGVFVRIGEVIGLVHQSEFDWEPKKLQKSVAVGEEIEVKVLEVKKRKRQVSLSAKACKPDPISSLEVGSVHEGTVERLVDYGAFIKIGSLTGLAHISELAEYRVSHPSELVMPGQTVSVMVTEVDAKKRRIGLSIRQAVAL